MKNIRNLKNELKTFCTQNVYTVITNVRVVEISYYGTETISTFEFRDRVTDTPLMSINYQTNNLFWINPDTDAELEYFLEKKGINFDELDYDIDNVDESILAEFKKYIKENCIEYLTERINEFSKDEFNFIVDSLEHECLYHYIKDNESYFFYAGNDNVDELDDETIEEESFNCSNDVDDYPAAIFHKLKDSRDMVKKFSL